MMRLIAGCLFLFTTVALGFAQGMSSKAVKKLVADRPSIYIEYQQLGRSISGEQEEFLWFRLQNNTKWSLRVRASGGITNLGDKTLFYSILSSYDKVGFDYPCRVCSIILLRSGQSILFGVPREHLANAYALRLTYSNEWENDLDVHAGLEPTHFVFFYVKNLPKDVRTGS